MRTEHSFAIRICWAFLPVLMGANECGGDAPPVTPDCTTTQVAIEAGGYGIADVECRGLGALDAKQVIVTDDSNRVIAVAQVFDDPRTLGSTIGYKLLLKHDGTWAGSPEEGTLSYTIHYEGSCGEGSATPRVCIGRGEISYTILSGAEDAPSISVSATTSGEDPTHPVVTVRAEADATDTLMAWLGTGLVYPGSKARFREVPGAEELKALNDSSEFRTEFTDHPEGNTIYRVLAVREIAGAADGSLKYSMAVAEASVEIHPPLELVVRSDPPSTAMGELERIVVEPNTSIMISAEASGGRVSEAARYTFSWVSPHLSVEGPTFHDVATESYFVTVTVEDQAANTLSKTFQVEVVERPRATLTIAKSGPRNGTVKTVPDGIECGDVCVATFPVGTLITVNTTSVDGAIVRFSGDCAPTEAMAANATVELRGDSTCTVHFDAPAPTGFFVNLDDVGAQTINSRFFMSPKGWMESTGQIEPIEVVYDDITSCEWAIAVTENGATTTERISTATCRILLGGPNQGGDPVDVVLRPGVFAINVVVHRNSGDTGESNTVTFDVQ